MESDTKAAMPALLILLLVGLSILCLSVSVVHKITHAGSGGPGSFTHDESAGPHFNAASNLDDALDSQFTVESNLGVRLRLPDRNNPKFNVVTVSLREYIGATPFAAYCQHQHALAEKQYGSDILDETVATIHGFPAYVVTARYLSDLEVDKRVMGIARHYFINIAPGQVVAISNSTGDEKNWAGMSDVLDASICTLEPLVPSVTPSPASPASPQTAAPQNPAPQPPMNHPAPHIYDPRAPESTDQLLVGLSSTNPLIAQDSMVKLTQITPDDAHRARVLSALIPLIPRHDWPTIDLPKALALWADDATEKKLIEKLDDKLPSHDCDVIFSFLTRRKTSTAAMAVASHIHQSHNSNSVLFALADMGPVAEPAIRSLLTDSDSTTVMFSLHILGRIGTADSLPALEKIAHGTNPADATWAKSAIRSIQSRTK